MNLQKILTFVAIGVGIISAFFLASIVSEGDLAIQDAAATGDTSAVAPLIIISYIVFGLAVLFALLFTIINIFSNVANLKSTLIGVGAFALIVLICYFGIAEGIETPLQDGETLSANGSRWVGTGLWVFYILSVIAIGLMILTGITKLFKK